MTRGAGQITAAGHTVGVSYAPADPELQEDIDAAYRQKHAGDYYLGHMVGAGSRAATVEITPPGLPLNDVTHQRQHRRVSLRLAVPYCNS